MKTNIRRSLKILIIPLIFGFGCSSHPKLNQFKSDGCSLFLDRSLIDEKSWCDCCVAHDSVYWHGGTKQERLQTDQKFRQCIIEKTGDEYLADMMYNAVRAGGSPYFPTWYRWGYGWNYIRGYKALTPQEKETIRVMLKKQ